MVPDLLNLLRLCSVPFLTLLLLTGNLHVFLVVCTKLGEQTIALSVGNKPTVKNTLPASATASITWVLPHVSDISWLHCRPFSYHELLRLFIYQICLCWAQSLAPDSPLNFPHWAASLPRLGWVWWSSMFCISIRTMPLSACAVLFMDSSILLSQFPLYSGKDVDLQVIVLDESGCHFDNFSSLLIDWSISDESFAVFSSHEKIITDRSILESGERQLKCEDIPIVYSVLALSGPSFLVYQSWSQITSLCPSSTERETSQSPHPLVDMIESTWRDTIWIFQWVAS